MQVTEPELKNHRLDFLSKDAAVLGGEREGEGERESGRERGRERRRERGR